MEQERILALLAIERRERFLRGCFDFVFVERMRRRIFRVLRRIQTRDPAKNKQIRERVATEAIRSVHARRAFTRREEPHDARLLRLGIDANAAHRVVGGRPDFHRVGRDVDVAQLFELVIHRRQFFLDVLGGAARCDVEEHAAVGRAASGLHFGVDGARDDVARQQIRRSLRRFAFEARVASRRLEIHAGGFQPRVGFVLVVRRFLLIELDGCSRT